MRRKRRGRLRKLTWLDRSRRIERNLRRGRTTKFIVAKNWAKTTIKEKAK